MEERAIRIQAMEDPGHMLHVAQRRQETVLAFSHHLAHTAFEIADDGPGFTVDVPIERLGSQIILPPKFESRREQIEARLTPLPDPRAGWTGVA